ncbi:MAG: hypothetical protein ACT4OZ_06645 [Gemmatimonadota bacterium]
MRLPSRSQWSGARAANVLRRPLQLATTAVLAFVAILAVYLLLPAAQPAVDVRSVQRPDTMLFKWRERGAADRSAEAEAALARRRALYSESLRERATLVAAATTSARRDSITAVMAGLAGLVVRAETAPLPETYKALAADPELGGRAEVRALVDSLDGIIRSRDALGRGATVDPRYVAQTTRATEIGRSLVRLGAARLEDLRRQLEADSGAAVRLVLPDTLPAREALDRAFAQQEESRQAVVRARLSHQAADSIEAEARERATIASPPILVLAAGVLACFLSLGAGAAAEMRLPRVSDAVEIERRTGLRVVAAVRPRVIPVERSRRAADRVLPVVLDPTADEYRMIVWHLQSRWNRDGLITVAAEEPLVAAAVGANVAAVLANEARDTLLIDTVFGDEPVSRVLDLPQSPGLAAVVENRKRWSETLRQIPVGRGRMMQVLQSGMRARALGPSETEALLTEVRRAGRRHDATVVVATVASAVRARAGDDVLVCAHVGVTPLVALERAIAAMIDGGGRVRGVVLWEGGPPRVQFV